SVVASSVLDAGQQKFAIAVAALDGRSDCAERAPARTTVEPGGKIGRDALTISRIAQQTALADRLAPGLELRFDQKQAARAGCGKIERRRHGKFQRNEADVAD